MREQDRMWPCLSIGLVIFAATWGCSKPASRGRPGNHTTLEDIFKTEASAAPEFNEPDPDKARLVYNSRVLYYDCLKSFGSDAFCGCLRTELKGEAMFNNEYMMFVLKKLDPPYDPSLAALSSLILKARQTCGPKDEPQTPARGKTYGDCMTSYGSNEFCQCLDKELPPSVDLWDYQGHVESSKESKDYQTAPSPVKELIEASHRAREVCVGRQAGKEKGS